MRSCYKLSTEPLLGFLLCAPMSPSRRLWLDGPLGQPMLLTSIEEERDGTATFLVFFFVFCFLLVLLQFRRVSLGGLASAPWGAGASWICRICRKTV